MMKAKLLPVQLSETNERERGEFAEQMKRLSALYSEEAEFLPVQTLESIDPTGADALLFVQLTGAIFAHRKELEAINMPLVVITSEFGTVEMWDWEIVAYLREQGGLNVLTPYNEELAKVILRALAAKRQMKDGAKLLMMQDDPGEGMQAYIFKRFYWWEKECTRQIEQAFGIKIVYRSWKTVNAAAAKVSHAEALALWSRRQVPSEGVPLENILKAVKLYIAIKALIDEIGDVVGVGSNCLNESFSSCTTPCLAWNWIFEYDHIIWACEGDTVTLISKYILHSALHQPIMMTNIYPFLVGMAALKHERIDHFPDIEDPDNHALGVHCGYFGLAPQSFCTSWTLRPKVLEIVNKDAVMVDCELPIGSVTLAKLHSDMKKLTIIEAELERYVQYPGSDCRNGGLLRYRNHSGHKVMEKLSSHHAIIIVGDVTAKLTQVAKVYGFEVEVI